MINYQSKRKNVYDKLKGKCYYCGELLNYNEFHLEHIIPKSQGGKNNINNLAPSCCLCNITKGSLNVEQYRFKITNLKNDNISVRLYLKHYKVFDTPVRFYFETIKNNSQNIIMGKAEENEHGTAT